ncbi:CapA family protein [Streptomyces sp. WAC05374]|uniref:CapA family protein n=1 Tax=Streptomyces sp. WAC05374 TaxID=2487420 RepID=UPI000F871CA8|nr:CapA family protein [Streptomyces sp. WAC05374]RST07177.1 CapA family protein [Streptomyces sp. WAC05374]TDF37886.1 CapA family protein [Streptomyces sp. WAC05374]TDF52742.1 CapA family protein [Streptomyces sp. WAC05374]TDF54161.1 CapA family protein [Streptomyces sp. WAC05374]
MSTTPLRRTTVAVATVLLAAAAGCAGAEPEPRTAAARPPQVPHPAPSSAGRAATAPERGFTLVASGDVLPHASIIRQAQADAGGNGYDFRPMLAGVAPVVSKADLAICHMETVYGKEGGPYTGYPSFKSPPQVATALAATGYDSCSTASNHTLDDGAAGLGRTLDALDKVGVRHAGSARTAAEAVRPTLLKAGGATVGHLAYTYGTNGIPLPAGRPWAVNLIDENKILADARAARAAGADVVVVSLHWGTEWQTDPDRQQLTLGRALTASATGGRPDVDLIIGTHAHVPQAYEKVNGTWIVYGMGDQIAGDMINYSGAFDPRGNQGTIGRFTFAPPAAPGGRWNVAKAEFLPQWFNTGTGRVVNLNAAIRTGENLTGVRDRIQQVALSRGAAKDGLLMGE